MADQNTPKDARDSVTFCADQGMPNLCGAAARGVSLQHKSHVMAASPDTFVFADEGLEDMHDDTYIVLSQNQTDVADQATIGSKTAKQFVITGPDAADVVDLVIIGQLKGQLK